MVPGIAGRPHHSRSGSGLRITSVASLRQSSPDMTGGVNLPSSITVSRVEPEISIVEDSIDTSFMPPGLSIQRAHAPPPLMRGGMASNSLQRSSQAQLIQQALQMQKQQLQAQLMQRPMRGMMTSAGFSAMKRPMMMASQGQLSKHPRLLAQLSGGNPDLMARAAAGGARCRICAQMSPFTQLIKENSDVVEALKMVLGLNLDNDDEDPSYPDVICKRCVTHLANLSQFKKHFEAGQLKLKQMAVSKKRPTSPSNISKTNTKIVSEAELHPDLDCEVDEGESVHPVPASKPGRNKSEDKDDSADEDEPINPMMFLQLSQVESNFPGGNEEEEDATNGNGNGNGNGGDAKDDVVDDEDADWDIDEELENEERVGNGHDVDADVEDDLEGGVEEIGDDEEAVEDDQDKVDDDDGEEGVDAELENLDVSLELESGDEAGADHEEFLDDDAENLEEDDDEA